jgi:hypothetical protein
MYSYLFHNRWVAAIWGAFMLISALAFVSEGGGQQKLDEAAAKLREGRRTQVSAPPPSYSEAIEPSAGYENLSDTNTNTLSDSSVHMHTASDEVVAPEM